MAHALLEIYLCSPRGSLPPVKNHCLIDTLLNKATIWHCCETGKSLENGMELLKIV